MEAPSNQKKPDPCCFVIFGATGDLAHRLVIPALYNLAATGLLPDEFCIIGIARKAMSSDALRDSLMKGLRQFATRPVDDAIAKHLLECLTCIVADPSEPASFDSMREQLEKLEATRKTGGNRLFYLATPPDAFAPISRELGRTGLLREENGAWRRLVVEKPFGTDLASARALNGELLKIVDEHQIYRIDHYLGKETVQNILALRFANGLFESIWNRDRIDHVQITVTETVNVEQRGRFYDAAGALRDMVPNHLFQLLSLIAMEPPSGFSAEAVRGEKTKALEAIRIASPEEAGRDGVRGQYGAGRVLGKKVVAYRKAPNVDRHSDTETYVALRLTIENWRWAGVPFYLRTGKALAARKTEIAIRFKEAPFAVFRDTPVKRLAQNFIVIRIAPDEGITIQFNAKVPGQGLQLEGVRMDFNYQDYFAAQPRNGYETLIYDCMRGDATLFQHAGDVEAAWRAVQPFLDAWRIAKDKGLGIYPAGSDGPVAADALLARDGRRWRPIVAKKPLAAPSTE
jgi:glucose-6-phosphate 1-dehydrogenase